MMGIQHWCADCVTQRDYADVRPQLGPANLTTECANWRTKTIEGLKTTVSTLEGKIRQMEETPRISHSSGPVFVWKHVTTSTHFAAVAS